MTIKIPINKIRIEHPLDIYEIMQRVLIREDKIDRGKEHFWVLALDSGNKIITLELVSMGSAKRTIAEPMEILSIPLQKGASGVILIHNHPGGTLEPSEADKEMTDRIIQACRLMNTPVLDHVIITENSYYSFKASGLLERLEASNKHVPPYELERQYHKMAELEKLEEKKKFEEKILAAMIDKGIDLKVIMEVMEISQEKIEKFKSDYSK